jgi:hypothetical protein
MFTKVFFYVFQIHVSSVSSVFFCMLQVLHLDVFKSRSGVAHGMHVESKRGGERSPHGRVAQVMSGGMGPHVGAGGRCRAARALAWTWETESKRTAAVDCSRGRPDASVRLDASSAISNKMRETKC